MRLGILQFIGVLLIINSILFGWYLSGKSPAKVVITLTALSVGAGLLLLIADRITDASLPFLGTFKAKADQIAIDAETVATLRQGVEAQAATVNLVAKEATDAKNLSIEARAKIEAADLKLQELNRSIEAGKKAQQQLEAFAKFQSTIVKAQSNDSAAFKSLWQIVNDPTDPSSQEAAQAFGKILDDHNSMMTIGYDLPTMGIAQNTEKMNLQELGRLFFSRQNPSDRVAIVQYLRRRSDISKHDRMQFFIEVLQGDPNLMVVEAAGREFSEDSNDQLKPLAIWQHVNWWSVHANEIK